MDVEGKAKECSRENVQVMEQLWFEGWVTT
jgi:hypothetical protein